MRFRRVAIAAVVLVLATTAAFAAYQIAADARAETAQQPIERTDSLAVEPDLRQTLVADTDHDPTAYGDSVTVVYNGTEWAPPGNYSYATNGTIEFLRDEPGEATITYTYDIPANQAADAQLNTATEGFGQVTLALVGGSVVVVLLFIGGFAARRMGVGSSNRPGRGR